MLLPALVKLEQTGVYPWETPDQSQGFVSPSRGTPRKKPKNSSLEADPKFLKKKLKKYWEAPENTFFWKGCDRSEDDRGTGQRKWMEESSAPHLACTPCVPLFCTLFTRGGNRRAFRLPGAGGGSFPLYGGTFARSDSVSSLGSVDRCVLPCAAKNLWCASDPGRHLQECF